MNLYRYYYNPNMRPQLLRFHIIWRTWQAYRRNEWQRSFITNNNLYRAISNDPDMIRAANSVGLKYGTHDKITKEYADVVISTTNFDYNKSEQDLIMEDHFFNMMSNL